MGRKKEDDEGWNNITSVTLPKRQKYHDANKLMAKASDDGVVLHMYAPTDWKEWGDF